MAVNFPNSPNSCDVHSEGGASWRYNGYAWARIPDPGAKGEPGENGQKGEVGSAGSTGIPSGFIGIWSGASNAIPSGWYLCNGSNGTPNLQDSFIVGAGSGYGVGATGGSSSVTLSTSNLPSHNHSFSATTSNVNLSHNHSLPDYAGGSQAQNQGIPSGSAQGATNYTTGSALGTHTHAVSGNTGTPSTNTTDTLGESATNKNLPPYYALIYIIKT